MTQRIDEIETFLATLHPYDSLQPDRRRDTAELVRPIDLPSESQIYKVGQPLDGLYIVAAGQVEVREAGGGLLSVLGPGNSFGERGLLRSGLAVTSARTTAESSLYMVPAEAFRRLLDSEPSFNRFYRRLRPADAASRSLAAVSAADLMGRGSVVCAPEDAISTVARQMRDRNVASILVVEDDALIGIITARDLTNRVLAEGVSPGVAARVVMTPNPATLPPDALCADALHLMLDMGVGHIPVVENGRPVGMLSQTDLTRYQAVAAANLVLEIMDAATVEAIAGPVARIPELLAQLVGAGQTHWAVTRQITDIADAATRRLLQLAEKTLGPPPVPYLWLACGSQGRQEQTGVSDQDNCLFLDDAATPEHDAYFAALAKFVSDGLDACGYFYCPGEMMATNPRWRKPVRVWREYFADWVRKPDPMAQMLASVMFDLRPIAGEKSLFANVHAETLAAASANSIFVAHMVSNSLKHTPPLSLFRGLATIRSGEHKDRVDLKLNGVVPVVDLARIYALQARLEPANTRARLVAAAEAGAVSKTGGRDLLHAFDVIASARLTHQAAQVRTGQQPDNFMAPGALSDLERSHLRDAFVVVKTMQSALGQGRTSVL